MVGNFTTVQWFSSNPFQARQDKSGRYESCVTDKCVPLGTSGCRQALGPLTFVQLFLHVNFKTT